MSLVVAIREALFVVRDLNACYFLLDLLTGPFLNIIVFLHLLASYQYQEVLVHDKCTLFNWFVKLSIRRN